MHIEELLEDFCKDSLYMKLDEIKLHEKIILRNEIYCIINKFYHNLMKKQTR